LWSPILLSLIVFYSFYCATNEASTLLPQIEVTQRL
jgi:hypothetical protein